MELVEVLVLSSLFMNAILGVFTLFLFAKLYMFEKVLESILRKGKEQPHDNGVDNSGINIPPVKITPKQLKDNKKNPNQPDYIG